MAKLQNNILCIFILLCMDCAAIIFAFQYTSWTYELLSINSTSDNDNLMKLDLRVDRISRSEMALSGTIDVKYETNDNTFIEVLTFRSASSNFDFKKLPFTIPKKTIHEFMNSDYKDMLMKSFADCSNLPHLEGDVVPRVEQKTYDLNKCIVSNENMPKHMPDGYYKVLVIGSGPFEWILEILLKIESA